MVWLLALGVVGFIIVIVILAKKGQLEPVILGIICFVAAMMCIIGLFWRQLLVMMAIGAVSIAALGVIFGKKDHLQTLNRVLIGLSVLFGGTWLAIQIAEPLLFGRKSSFSEWLREHWHIPIDVASFADPRLLAATGIAALLASPFVSNTLRGATVFIGTLLVIFFAPFVWDMNFLTELFVDRDPVFQLAVVGGLLFGLYHFARLVVGSAKP